MTGETDEKKVVAIRTFADDVRRARTKAGIAAPEPTPPETPTAPKQPPSAKPPAQAPERHTPVVSTPDPQTPPPATPAPQKEPAEPEYENEFGESVTLSDEHIPELKENKPTPIDIPPVQRKIEVPREAIAAEAEQITEGKQSVHTVDGLFDAEEAAAGGGEGTIVIDKKRDGFKLFPAIFKSVTSWFKGKQKAYKQARTPEKTVERASRRKAVIEAASSQAQQAPHDDYQHVVERLKDVERVDASSELQIKDEEVIAPHWKYQSNEQVRDPRSDEAVRSLEAAVSANHDADTSAASDITVVEQSPAQMPADTDTKTPASTPEVAPEPAPLEPSTPPHTPEPAPAEPQQPTSTPASIPTPSEEPTPTPTPEPAPVPEPAQVEQPPTSQAQRGFAEYREHYGDAYNPREQYFNERESLKPAPEAPPEEIERPQLQRTGVPEYRRKREGQPRRNTSRTATVLTFAAVIGVAVVLGIGTSIWWFTRDANQVVVVTQPETQDLVSAGTVVPIELLSDRRAFYATLRDALQKNGGSIIRFSVSGANGYASPNEILDVLSPNAPGSFLRAIDGLSFGGVGGQEPFMVLRFDAFDTVFAGMLAWESSMSTDLAPLFGAGADTTGTDARVQNRDVRVLVDRNNNDVIVYGFVDKQTILITTSRGAYADIIPSIR